MLSFARSEDWSRRLPEFREYLTKLDNMRGTDFRKTFRNGLPNGRRMKILVLGTSHTFGRCKPEGDIIPRNAGRNLPC